MFVVLLKLVLGRPSANWYSDTPYDYFKSTITVPPIPDIKWSTLFLWPGLQPTSTGSNFLPIDNGVLHPVLTFGESCAPNPSNLQIDLSSTWWISAQYVNTFGEHPGYIGCHGGNRMPVNVGDNIRMIMELQPNSTIWSQQVVNLNNQKEVSFSIDMKHQEQGWAEFVMENTTTWFTYPPQFNVSDIELRTSFLNPTGFCRYVPNLSDTDATIDCDSPQFPKPNVCTISNCIFNQNSTIINTQTASSTPSLATASTQAISPTPTYLASSGYLMSATSMFAFVCVLMV